MTTDHTPQSDPAQTDLLLNLSSDRRRQAEQLAKHEYRALINDIETAAHIYIPTGQPDPSPPSIPTLDPAFRAAAYSGLPPLNVPLGSIVGAIQSTDLPVIGILIADEAGDILKRSLLTFFSEHHQNPFCRPLFLCSRLDMLPFFRRFDIAACYQSEGWSEDDFKVLQMRFGLTQVRSVATGATIF